MARPIRSNIFRILAISATVGLLSVPSCKQDLPPDKIDDDGDMIPNVGEDRDMDGVVDPGETDPGAVDTDDDGILDDAEVSTLACAKVNDRPFAVFDSPGSDSMMLMDEEVSVRSTLRTPDNKAPGAAFNDPGRSVAAVMVGKRPSQGVATPSAQRDYERINSILQVGTVTNQQTRAFTTVQGYEAEQARFVVRANAGTTAARTANTLASLFLGGAQLTGTLPPDGPSSQDLSINLLTIYRSQTLVVLVASVVAGDPTGDQAIRMEEFTDGTNVARHGSFTRHVCDQFVTEEKAAADILWIVDDSGSMEDDQMAVRDAADAMAEILTAAQVDFRLGVARTFAPEFTDNRRGNLVGGDLTRDLDEFRDRVVVGAQGGWEPGLYVGIQAIDNLSPRTAPGQEQPDKLRDDAALIVIQMSDERDQEVECSACEPQLNCAGGQESTQEGAQDFCTGPGGQQIIDRYIADYTQRGATAFALVGDLPNGCSQTATRDDFEPGQGYVEVANATGGSFGSLCGDMRMNMENIAFAAVGVTSSYQLSAVPASATIRVAIGPPGMGRALPRSRDLGFDYDPVTNRIALFGDIRPQKGDEVVVGYRRWDWAGNPNRPGDPCDNCSLGAFCDPEADIADCQPICGETVCDPAFACLPDYGTCGDPNNNPGDPDSDGDGIPDSQDPDDNNDGVPDDVCGGCSSGSVCNPSNETCVQPCEETGCTGGQVCSSVTHLCQIPDF